MLIDVVLYPFMDAFFGGDRCVFGCYDKSDFGGRKKSTVFGFIKYKSGQLIF